MATRIVTTRSTVTNALTRLDSMVTREQPFVGFASEVLESIVQGSTLLVVDGETGVIMCNWEPAGDCWYVVLAFGTDEELTRATARVVDHLATLPPGRQMVWVKEAATSYLGGSRRGSQIDDLLFRNFLSSAELVQDREYTGVRGKRFDTWWKIDTSQGYQQSMLEDVR